MFGLGRPFCLRAHPPRRWVRHPQPPRRSSQGRLRCCKVRQRPGPGSRSCSSYPRLRVGAFAAQLGDVASTGVAPCSSSCPGSPCPACGQAASRSRGCRACRSSWPATSSRPGPSGCGTLILECSPAGPFTFSTQRAIWSQPRRHSRERSRRETAGRACRAKRQPLTNTRTRCCPRTCSSTAGTAPVSGTFGVRSWQSSVDAR